MRRGVLKHPHGFLQLDGRHVEAFLNVRRHAQRHVCSSKRGKKFPHLQSSQGTVASNFARDKEPLESLQIHLGEGLEKEEGLRQGNVICDRQVTK